MWPNPQKTFILVTFTEEILNGKRYMENFIFCAALRNIYREAYA